MNPLFKHIEDTIEIPDGYYWESDATGSLLYLRNSNEKFETGPPANMVIDEFEITLIDHKGFLSLAVRTEDGEKPIMACHAAAPGPHVESIVNKIKELVESLRNRDGRTFPADLQ